MTWNYRLTKYDYPHGGGTLYCVREVFYDEDRKLSWTEDEVSPSGETLEEFFRDLDRYLECKRKPVIDLNQVEANGFIYEGEK